MTPRLCALLLLTLLAACETTNPLAVTGTFHENNGQLTARNPADIAVLAVEDGTQDHQVARLCEQMRQTLMRRLPDRLYSPIKARVVDAALRSTQPTASESMASPAYLKRAAGLAKEDALLVVRIDQWDESRLLVDNRVRLQLTALIAGADGEVLWNGSVTGEVKAGGEGASPRDREAMARSCADLAMECVLKSLPPRRP